MIRTLYPSLVNPPDAFDKAIPGFESTWHEPWSEPVKQKISPVLAVALIASGLFAPVLGPSQPGPSYESAWHQAWSEPQRSKRFLASEQQSSAFVSVTGAEVITPDKWLYPWSEPVRFRSLPTSEQQFTAYGPPPILTGIESLWQYPWSEPVRLKPGLSVALQQFTTPPAPAYPILSRLTQWFEPLNEPVRLKKGLPTSLQHHLEFTALKPPQAAITITLSAKELNLDVALFGILVYDVIPTPYVLIAGANVTVSEIQATNAGAASIEET